jgi:hypothetical protein
MRGGVTSFSPYGPAAPSSNAQQLMAQRITQAQGAASGIEQLLGYNPQTGTTTYMPKLIASVLSEMYGGTVLGNAAVNFIDPKAGQYMQQAKLFVEPVLRIASGAAIRPEEYHDYFQMFIPMPGDPPALVKSKIDAMHVWAQTTGQAATTDQALAMMASAAQNNPVLQQQIVRVRNDATQSGRLGLPVYQAAAGAGQTQPGATPAPPPAAPPPPAVDHNRVKAILGMQ